MQAKCKFYYIFLCPFLILSILITFVVTSLEHENMYTTDQKFGHILLQEGDMWISMVTFLVKKRLNKHLRCIQTFGLYFIVEFYWRNLNYEWRCGVIIERGKKWKSKPIFIEVTGRHFQLQVYKKVHWNSVAPLEAVIERRGVNITFSCFSSTPTCYFSHTIWTKNWETRA